MPHHKLQLEAKSWIHQIMGRQTLRKKRQTLRTTWQTLRRYDVPELAKTRLKRGRHRLLRPLLFLLFIYRVFVRQTAGGAWSTGNTPARNMRES